MENTARISFPFPFDASNAAMRRSVLESIAACCAQHLRQGGYFSNEEADEMLRAYHENLDAIESNPLQGLDFLMFSAEVQAQKHSVTVEGEIHRMQTLLLLRWNPPERVYSWTFGTLPGRPSSLYDYCPVLQACCALLGCPAVLAGEASVVHVASINPIAVHAAATLIGNELAKVGGEYPIVFPFMINLALWTTLSQRHFAS